MIPYVEIKDKYTLKTITKVEPSECWFELSYQDVGECEVYCVASQSNLQALQKGRYLKIPNKRFIWVITAVHYTYSADGVKMISATGKEAKWLLNKRCILTPKELKGNITTALYRLVNDNIGTNAGAARKVDKFTVDTNSLLIDISGTQAPRGNLLEFANNLLKNYNCGSQVVFEGEKLVYKIFTGAVKTTTVKFSQSLDNLLSSEYLTDDAELATFVQVVSTFEETKTVNGAEEKHKVDYIKEVDANAKGIDRAEIYLESNLSTKYTDADGVEKETTPDSELYKGWQVQEGYAELAKHKTIEEINGEIDLAHSNYKFDKDFFVGDMVRIQDEYFNFYVNTIITKYTIKQDAKGYGEEAQYGE